MITMNFKIKLTNSPGERHGRGEGGPPPGGLSDPAGRKPPPDEGRFCFQEVRIKPDPKERLVFFFCTDETLFYGTKMSETFFYHKTEMFKNLKL